MKRAITRQAAIIGAAILCLCSHPIGLSAQVITRVLGEGQDVRGLIPWRTSGQAGLEAPIVFKQLPAVDAAAVSREDSITGREMPRIGVKREVGWGMEDGEWSEHGNFYTWRLAAYAEGAKSLSLRFEGLSLPPGSSMYIYNDATRFLIGPIRQQNIQAGKYNSDYLNGSYAIVEAMVPKEAAEGFRLGIGSYDFGVIELRNSAFDEDFGTSLDCNVNTACPEGQGWEHQIRSVCKIIHPCIGACTGTLINNECNDLTPFLLTANHCICEENLGEYIFRFNYESPVCTDDSGNPQGVEPPPSAWLTYSGAELRASWGGTDFALLELNEPAHPDLAFSGWDRSGVPPQNSTYIHHPSGDVKKISFDAGVSNINGLFFEFELTPGVNGDFGSLQGSSSGAAQFNDNRLIVGQHSGGTPWIIECDSGNNQNWNGMLFHSWAGAGTDISRLCNWLGNCGQAPPVTIDGIEIPAVEGEFFLCDSEAYVLTGAPPGYGPAEWSASPAHLFSPPAAGSGPVASLSRNGVQKGGAAVAFRLERQGCGAIELEKDIWVGEPVAITNVPDPTICVGRLVQENEYLLPQSPGATAYALSSGSPSLYVFPENPEPGQPVMFIATQPGLHPVYLTASNPCGQASAVIYIEAVDCDSGPFHHRPGAPGGASLFPNPAYGTVSVRHGYDRPVQAAIMSPLGVAVDAFWAEAGQSGRDIARLPAGVYFLKLMPPGEPAIVLKFVKR
jgi:lysyl endopeptidase